MKWIWKPVKDLKQQKVKTQTLEFSLLYVNVLFGTLTFLASSISVKVLLKTHSGLDLQHSSGFGQVDLFFLWAEKIFTYSHFFAAATPFLLAALQWDILIYFLLQKEE